MNVMRPTRLTTKCTANAVLSLLLGAAVLATSLPARAEEDVPIDTKIFRGIMEGLGLRRDGEAINYQERAPLVIPPSRTLPPPEKSDEVIARNPAWPNDPDVARRKAEEKLERNRNISDERERESRPLREDQMTPGPGRKKQASRDDGYQSSPDGFSKPLSPSELGYKGNLFGSMFGNKEEEVAKFTKEPPRASLTAPPPGYQTPSPDQPYGLGKERPKSKTSADYLLEHAAGER
jgi:hypothetical protein